MLFGGFIKQSLLDYPGNIASVVFTKGCNFRCPYCHNSQLVLPDLLDKKGFDEQTILWYLKKNSLLLDALVVTGGEPTLHKQLPAFLRNVKNTGLKIKLDTNGTNPEMINKLLNDKLIDALAMDIKTVLDFKHYSEITGNQLKQEEFENIKQSIALIKNRMNNYEFRTTVLKKYHSKATICEIFKQLQVSIHHYKLNAFKDNENCITPIALDNCYTDTELEDIFQSLYAPMKI